MTTVAVQYRRGTTAQHTTFTGLAGELTVDTSKSTVVVHDGTTAGGFPLQKEIAGFANIVFTTGSYANPAWVTSLAYSKLSGPVPTWNQSTTGNAATVTNGVYTTGAYADPSWLTALALSKITDLGTGVSTFLATPTSASLLAAVTDETGTGSLVFGTTPTITALREVKVDLAASNIDLSTGAYFSKTITAATTFTVTNPPSANLIESFLVELTNGGAFLVTWWSGVKWIAGSAPLLTASGRDVLGFYTTDGGATWTGITIGRDFK